MDNNNKIDREKTRMAAEEIVSAYAKIGTDATFLKECDDGTIIAISDEQGIVYYRVKVEEIYEEDL